MEEQKKEMNVYLYVLILTSVTALVLSLLYTSLNPMFLKNKAAAKRKAILNCIPVDFDLDTDEKVNAIYEGQIKMYAISAEGDIYESDSLSVVEINELGIGSGAKNYANLEELDLANEEKKAESDRVYPVYVFEGEEGNYYVVGIRGNGLWDKIWGYIALEKDLNTIAGVYFDHKNETPGLGAEIKDSEKFKAAFIGKKVFQKDENDEEIVAVAVIKREPAADNLYHVKGISGATITSDGVTDMFVSGMKHYETYFQSLKK